jgi:hypothetical protein
MAVFSCHFKGGDTYIELVLFCHNLNAIFDHVSSHSSDFFLTELNYSIYKFIYFGISDVFEKFGIYLNLFPISLCT